jgi:nicotinate-nucleotide--dimethylbenzimidazole phosphoribosyltransferase
MPDACNVVPDLPAIPLFDKTMADRVLKHVEAQARPPGALARLERIAAQLAGIQASEHPEMVKITAMLFAADHGLTSSGVSSYPSSVTASMVRTFLAGRASANALALACDVELTIVDAGVNADLVGPKLITRKIAMGTRDASVEAAMSRTEAASAIHAGVRLAQEAADAGARALILGEMGIGNTASSALLVHRLAPAALPDCVGQGAGHDATGLARKRDVLSRAAARTDASEPFTVLCEFGGLEIAMMVGAALGAASRRSVILVDGFISTAAVLVAIRLCPSVTPFCIYGHRSGEPGHRVALAALDAEPLLDLGLRLGEGTGAILAAPLVRAAARLPDGVANLAEVLRVDP